MRIEEARGGVVALRLQPRAMFLDEPTSGLDSTMAADVIKCLSRLQARMVVRYYSLFISLACTCTKPSISSSCSGRRAHIFWKRRTSSDGIFATQDSRTRLASTSQNFSSITCRSRVSVYELLRKVFSVQ